MSPRTGESGAAPLSQGVQPPLRTGEKVPDLLQIHPAPKSTMTNPVSAKPFPGTNCFPPSPDAALGTVRDRLVPGQEEQLTGTRLPTLSTKDQRSPTAQELPCLPQPGRSTRVLCSSPCFTNLLVKLLHTVVRELHSHHCFSP